MIMTIADAAAEYVRAHRVERQSTALYSDRPVELTIIQNKWADATKHERQTIVDAPAAVMRAVETSRRGHELFDRVRDEGEDLYDAWQKAVSAG